MLLGDDLLYRELAYEAMSRGRKENRIYMSRATVAELDLQLEDGPHARTVGAQDAIEILAAGLERRRNKHLALDSIASVPLDAWSTSDLIAERDPVRADPRPSPSRPISRPRLADRDRGETSRRSCEQAKRSVAALECRKRPRRERRLPDVDLLTQRHNLAYFEHQAERLDREIAALHANQHRRASHLAAHRADRVELDAIGDVLDERVSDEHQPRRRRAAELHHQDPREPPGEAASRTEHGCAPSSPSRSTESSTTSPTDGPPSAPNQPSTDTRLDWCRVSETILDALDVISPPSRTIQPTVPTIEGPSLDIGL